MQEGPIPFLEEALLRTHFALREACEVRAGKALETLLLQRRHILVTCYRRLACLCMTT